VTAKSGPNDESLRLVWAIVVRCFFLRILCIYELFYCILRFSIYRMVGRYLLHLWAIDVRFFFSFAFLYLLTNIFIGYLGFAYIYRMGKEKEAGDSKIRPKRLISHVVWAIDVRFYFPSHFCIY
jgi:hypothetical protein